MLLIAVQEAGTKPVQVSKTWMSRSTYQLYFTLSPTPSFPGLLGQVTGARSHSTCPVVRSCFLC